MSLPERVSVRSSASGAKLARRLFSNYAFQTVNWGVRIFEQLLLVPFYVFAWGTDLYKDWIVLFAIAAFLTWCSFGVDEYFGNIFLRLVSIGDTAGLTRAVRMGLFVSALVTAAMMATLVGLLLTVNLSHDLALSAMDNHTALFCLVLLTVPICVWYMIETLKAVYRAYGDFSRGEAVIAVAVLVQIGSFATALALREPPQIIALCYCLALLSYAAFTVFDVCRRYPAVRLGFVIPRRHEWREIIPQSLLYFTNSLAQSFTQNAALLIFGLLRFDTLATVQFNLLRIFTGATRQVGSHSFAIGSGIEMARQWAQNDVSSCRKLYADSGRIVSGFVGILAGVSIPLSTIFIPLWTHGAVSSDPALVLCFLVGIFLSAPGRASLMLLRYTNHAYATAIASCGYAIGGLALAVPLAWMFGGLGVAVAFTTTEILAVGLFPPLMVGARFRFGAFRHLLNSYFAGALAFLVSYVPAQFLFAVGKADLAGIVLRLALWAGIVIPLGVALALPRTRRRQLFADIRRRLTPVGLLSMK